MMGRTLALALLLALPAHAGTPFHTSSVPVAATSTTVQVAQTAVTARYDTLLLINISDTTMWCNLAGAAAVVGSGVPLKKSSSATDPDGGALFLDESSRVPNAAVNCIHGGTGNKTLIKIRDR